MPAKFVLKITHNADGTKAYGVRNVRTGQVIRKRNYRECAEYLNSHNNPGETKPKKSRRKP